MSDVGRHSMRHRASKAALLVQAGAGSFSDRSGIEPATQIQSQVQSRSFPHAVHPRTQTRSKRRGRCTTGRKQRKRPGSSLEFLPTNVGAGHPSFGGWRTSGLPCGSKRLLCRVVPRIIATQVAQRSAALWQVPSQRTAPSRKVLNSMRAFPNLTPNPSFQRTASGGR